QGRLATLFAAGGAGALLLKLGIRVLPPLAVIPRDDEPLPRFVLFEPDRIPGHLRPFRVFVPGSTDRRRPYFPSLLHHYNRARSVSVMGPRFGGGRAGKTRARPLFAVLLFPRGPVGAKRLEVLEHPDVERISAERGTIADDD